MSLCALKLLSFVLVAPATQPGPLDDPFLYALRLLESSHQEGVTHFGRASNIVQTSSPRFAIISSPPSAAHLYGDARFAPRSKGFSCPRSTRASSLPQAAAAQRGRAPAGGGSTCELLLLPRARRRSAWCGRHPWRDCGASPWCADSHSCVSLPFRHPASQRVKYGRTMPSSLRVSNRDGGLV